MESPGAGILLIADPFLKDPNFKRTVVFLCEHKEEGSFGFVLNKSYNHKLDELVSGAEDLKIDVYFGGPVQMDTIHFLHTYPDKIPGSYEITNGVHWGGDFEMAISLLRAGEIDRNRIRFFIGYSGWGVGQLDDELKEKSWLTVQATRKLVFHKQMDEIWKEALRMLGGDYEVLINYPTDPTLN
ncbi:MAG TPA: YqgE/AlgH family protein [Puia sp.]|nr:YqgE/AlgH family protein [Puia sp.]